MIKALAILLALAGTAHAQEPPPEVPQTDNEQKLDVAIDDLAAALRELDRAVVERAERAKQEAETHE